MVLRSIIIIPKFTNMAAINELRKKYDPLVDKIPPHITLVFPFASSFTTEELREHVTTTLAGVPAFEVKLKGITGSENGYLFLNVKQGNDQIIELHDRLYSGLLASYIYRKATYCPHLTVGKVETSDLFEQAMQMTRDFDQEFATTVEEIIVEWIDEKEVSQIDLIHRF